MTHRTHTIPRLSRRHLAGRPAQKPTKSATPLQAVDPLNEEIDALASSIVHHADVTAQAAEDDPMLGDFSYTATLLRSVVTRVGQVIPDVIALALRQHDDYLVLREYKLPLTRVASEIIQNNRATPDIEVRSDTLILGSFDTDLIVIERRTRHATLIECVRGSVALSGPRTKSLVQKVRVAALSARSALEQDGHRINTVSAAIYDRSGRAGHEGAMTVRAEQIDGFLGLPVLRYLDRLDERIRDELVRTLDPSTDGASEADLHPEREDGGLERAGPISQLPEAVTFAGRPRLSETRPLVDLSRSIGPAERRRRLDAAAREDDLLLRH